MASRKRKWIFGNEYSPPKKKRSLTSSCSLPLILSPSKPQRFAQNIPADLLRIILSFVLPSDYGHCSAVNKFYHTQCLIMWQKLAKMEISPMSFPTLNRNHMTLHWIIFKTITCTKLSFIKIKRTVMNAQMFQTLCKNCPNLKHLHFDENPLIFLMGNDGKNIFKQSLFEEKPCFKLESFCIESMQTNLTQNAFDRLLNSSKQSIKKLVLRKRDPFKCSFCGLSSLCKWQKCQNCNVRSYCNKECQTSDWTDHERVCLHHQSPNNELLPIRNILDTILCFHSLHSLNLSYSYNIGPSALHLLCLKCPNLCNIELNGCDVSNEGIICLAKNLHKIQKLHIRASRYIQDSAIDCLVQMHYRSLRDLDVSRCCLLTKKSILNVIKHCFELTALSIACGIKRGGFIWCIDDEMADAIVRSLKKLINLHYLKNDKVLSEECERKLFEMNNLKIERITTDKQISLIHINGHWQIDVINETVHKYPVIMEHIQKGKVVHSHRFKR